MVCVLYAGARNPEEAVYRVCAVAAVVVLAACGQREETPNESVSLGSISLSEQATTDLQTYATKASAFVQSFDSGADDATLSAQAQALMDLSETIVPAYVEVYPGCKEHLNAALKITDTWQDLDPETIERDYHQDAALPDPAPGADCYHMKDLVVHPATALALLNQPEVDREQVRHEMAEVAAHAGAVRTGVGFNSSDGD